MKLKGTAGSCTSSHRQPGRPTRFNRRAFYRSKPTHHARILKALPVDAAYLVRMIYMQTVIQTTLQKHNEPYFIATGYTTVDQVDSTVRRTTGRPRTKTGRTFSTMWISSGLFNEAACGRACAPTRIPLGLPTRYDDSVHESLQAVP